MATNDALNNNLSGQTGSGEYVGSNDPTFPGNILVGDSIIKSTATNTYIELGADFLGFVTGGGYKALFHGSGFSLTSGVAVNSIRDEDDMASNSASALATQQSIKAYVDGLASQVVQYSYTTSSTTDTTTSTSMSDSSLMGSITPISASNKIIVICSGRVIIDNPTNNNASEYTAAWDIRRSTGTPANIMTNRRFGRKLIADSTIDALIQDSFFLIGSEEVGDLEGSEQTYILRFSTASSLTRVRLISSSDVSNMLILELKG